MKKYTDIVRLGHKSTADVLKPGDNIVIWEKIDGANASFKLENGALKCFSRNTELTPENNLGGFYQWVMGNVDPDAIIPGVIYFGEWTNPHKVAYPEHQKKFFLFDVYDEIYGIYFSAYSVKNEAKRLGINLAPIFYEGPYVSFEHLQSFVGRTDLGGMLGDKQTGEGIVVKNVDYRDRFGNQMFVKLVTESFAEVQKQKLPKDPNVPKTPEWEFAQITVTEARVDKMLRKLVDEQILEPNFGIEDMGKILKELNPRIAEDILKEESDSLPENWDIKVLRKEVGKTLPSIVKSVLNA